LKCLSNFTPDYPKWDIEPGAAVKTDKSPSILGKLTKNAIDNNWGSAEIEVKQEVILYVVCCLLRSFFFAYLGSA
jgi:hypothetical protein